jgi:hypothetical protein
VSGEERAPSFERREPLGDHIVQLFIDDAGDAGGVGWRWAAAAFSSGWLGTKSSRLTGPRTI